jgi:flagellar biosynthetic protein FliQ
MTEAYVLSLTQNVLMVVLMLAGPVLLASLVVGTLVSLFQVATQLNEATLMFIPKLIAIALVLVLLGSWMAQQLLVFTSNLFTSLPTLPR